MGSQTTDYQGERKTARKVLLGFEVLDDETRRDDGEPFVLSQRYTLSLHEKAALRKDLASWRGRDFTAEELRGFDLKNVLNAPAFISVVEVTKDGKVFSNIASIMKVPKGMSASPATEPTMMWDEEETIRVERVLEQHYRQRATWILPASKGTVTLYVRND